MRPRPVCSHLVPASPIYHEPLYGFISFLFTWLAQPARQRVFNWLMAAALLAAVGPLLLPV